MAGRTNRRNVKAGGNLEIKEPRRPPNRFARLDHRPLLPPQIMRVFHFSAFYLRLISDRPFHQPIL